MSKNWEDGDTYGADILGFGQFQFVPGGSGKTKAKTQIGFVRAKQKQPPKKVQAPKQIIRKKSK
jgi:hypothetical protein